MKVGTATEGGGAPTRVGVLSDTHGLLRPEALAALADSDLILHAGDVGDPEVLERLRRMAPVLAVRGNVDRGSWAADLPETRRVEVGDVSLCLLHDLGRLGAGPAPAGCRVVLYGHSHRPAVAERDGVLFLNPGSAGPRRFRLPVSVARLRIEGSRIKPELVDLSVGGDARPTP